MLTHAVTFSEELLVLFAVKCLHAYYFISSVGSLVCLVHVISQFTKRKFSTTATCNCQICGFRLLLYNPTVASSETSHADQPPPMARPRQVNQIEKKIALLILVVFSSFPSLVVDATAMILVQIIFAYTNWKYLETQEMMKGGG
jgi:hypothetical protein